MPKPNRFAKYQPKPTPPADEKALIIKGREHLKTWIDTLSLVPNPDRDKPKSPDYIAEEAAHMQRVNSEACALAIGYEYITPSNAMTFGPKVLDVILSPDGMEAFKLGLISGASVEKLVSQQEDNRAAEMLKGFVDPNKRKYYLEHPGEINKQIFPNNAPKPQL